jgi:hypothetical protein
MVGPSDTLGSHAPYYYGLKGIAVGDFQDQADAEWIVIRTQLRGHNNTPFGRPTPGRPIGSPGVGRPSGPFCVL